MTIRQRSVDMLIGALTGYLYGWLLGWSVVSPDLDWWAPVALVCALAGLLLGVLGVVERYRKQLFGFLAGLYLAWILRTMILGDAPSFAGTLLISLGTLLGWIMAGSLLANFSRTTQLVALVTAFAAGNLYGLIGVLEPTRSLAGWVPVVVMTSAISALLWSFIERRMDKKTH